MKTIYQLGIHSMIIASLIILSSALLSSLYAEPDERISDFFEFAFPLQAEDTADLCTHPVPVQVAESEIILATQSFSVNHHSLPAFIQTIDSASIRQLRLYPRMIRKSSPDCGDFLTGLKIHLGLNATDDSICLLFKPVLLCKVQNKDDFYSISWSHENYFKFNGSHFVSTTNTLCLSQYASKIQFKEANGSSRSIDVSADSSGDTKSLLFTFQELDSVLMSNKSDVIHFWNSAIQFSLASNNYIKHSILLSPKQYAPQDFKSRIKRHKLMHLPFVAFGGKYANRSHLCPPSCDEFLYKKHQAGTHCP